MEQFIRRRSIIGLATKSQEGSKECTEQYRLAAKEQPEGDKLVTAFQRCLLRFMRQFVVHRFGM
ncbi:hypothetical protein D3C76_1723330 [compost metagenome]